MQGIASRRLQWIVFIWLILASSNLDAQSPIPDSKVATDLYPTGFLQMPTSSATACSDCPLTDEAYPIVFGHPLEHRLVRISTNFLVTSNLIPALDVLTEAASLCYNGILLSDVKFGFIHDMPSYYFDNLETFLDSAKVLNMNVIPEAAFFGYSQPILYHDPHLVESLPVVNAPFVVEDVGGNKVLNNVATDVFPLLNGDFEAVPSTPNVFPNWGFQDNPGLVTFWDNTESHSGAASARISDPNGNMYGNGRMFQTVNVQAFRDYRINFWVKTDNFTSGFTNVYIVNTTTNRVLNYNNFNVSPTQGWTEYDITFNTLDATQIAFAFGVWSGSTGDMWLDDIEITPTKFNNIVRRSTTPVSIALSDGTPLTEGIDVDMIIDPMMGVDPYSGAYSIWHNQPEIGIPASSPLQVGDEILVSYYHAAILQNGQVCASLTEADAIDISEQQFVDMKDVFEAQGVFKAWMFSHDEIRVNAWDQSPSYGSPGANLAWNITELYNRAKSISSDACLMIWSDMVDPFHNAYNDPSDPYYLVNGSWHESWLGLPSDVMILNWNFFGQRINAAQHFSDRGHQQILAGFYDQATYHTPTWLQDIQGMTGVRGVMYTTWVNDYSKLADWANAVFGACDYTTLHTAQLEISLKTLLQGAYNGTEMDTDLNDNGLLPMAHPYGAMHSGTESVTSIPNSDIVDWVLVELRYPQNLVQARRAAFLKKDGSIVDLDGSSPVQFSQLGRLDYYIAIRHRNHLGVMTDNMICLEPLF